jgi:D-sedoheptulose 7-phosphate isomerase
MSIPNLGLVARSGEFQSVVANSVYTDSSGNVFDIELAIHKIIQQLTYNREQENAVYLIGNGGSAGIASHALTDFLNVCRLRAFTLHDSSLITCMANDFGYENAYARILSTVIRPGDTLIAISSSGKSANICNAAKMATEMGGVVVTLSGFHPENPLRQLGDINVWLDSSDYGMVEIGHSFVLHNIADRIGAEIKKMRSVSAREIVGS